MPLCRKHSIEAENQKWDIVFCCSSMSVASAEGSHWETAVAILMLRHSMMMKTPNCPEAKNMWVWAREGRETTGRSSSEVALRTPPNDNEAPPEKRRNGGGDVFSGGCARRALRPAPPGEARTAARFTIHFGLQRRSTKTKALNCTET